MNTWDSESSFSKGRIGGCLWDISVLLIQSHLFISKQYFQRVLGFQFPVPGNWLLLCERREVNFRTLVMTSLRKGKSQWLTYERGHPPSHSSPELSHPHRQSLTSHTTPTSCYRLTARWSFHLLHLSYISVLPKLSFFPFSRLHLEAALNCIRTQRDRTSTPAGLLTSQTPCEYTYLLRASDSSLTKRIPHPHCVHPATLTFRFFGPYFFIFSTILCYEFM